MKRLFSFIVSLLVCYSAMAQRVATHTVAAGETLASIAAKYGITESALKEANPETRKFVYSGMELVIPNKPIETVSQTGQSTITTSSETRQETPPSYISKPKQENVDSDGRTGRVGFTDEILWGYVFPDLGDYGEAAFCMGMSISMGARYYPAQNFYLEGMVGYKGLLTNTGMKGSKLSEKTIGTYHFVTIPLHVGYSIPSKGKVSLGLFGGTRVDIPVYCREERNNKKEKVKMPVTASIEVGVDISFTDWAIRLQYDYSPSKKNKYSMISIGVSYPF